MNDNAGQGHSLLQLKLAASELNCVLCGVHSSMFYCRLFIVLRLFDFNTSSSQAVLEILTEIKFVHFILF
jgi:hypothetical protein